MYKTFTKYVRYDHMDHKVWYSTFFSEYWYIYLQLINDLVGVFYERQGGLVSLLCNPPCLSFR